MKVLVIGGGGREHALVWKIARSPRVTKIYCAPGNAGISEMADCVDIPPTDVSSLLSFAYHTKIDLTVVGPEGPLASGIVNAFQEKGLPVFGPTREAALVETSKVFAKDLMVRCQIPTAGAETFSTPTEAIAHIRKHGAPLVIKADGLAAGKGVIVAQTRQEAEDAVDLIMNKRAFGEAGEKVLVEEHLSGTEATLMTVTDGETVLPLASAQDYKRLSDGDTGPNTGGMGAYAPASVLGKTLTTQVMEEIIRPALRGLTREGRPYRGVLYAGLMLTPDGPKVLEFNARFGDPEAQVVLPLMDTDLMDVLEGCVQGRLKRIDLRWKDGAAVCVVLTSRGYPDRPETGKRVTGIDQVTRVHGVSLFHAGTRTEGNHVVTAGGRVFGVTATGAALSEARERAYGAAALIQFDGKHYRKDIGLERHV